MAHLWGPGNAPSDAGSRGREPLMRELLAALGCAPKREATPPLVPELLGELVELNRSLTAEERFLGSTRRNEYTGDSPVALRQLRPGPALGSRLAGPGPSRAAAITAFGSRAPLAGSGSSGAGHPRRSPPTERVQPLALVPASPPAAFAPFRTGGGRRDGGGRHSL